MYLEVSTMPFSSVMGPDPQTGSEPMGVFGTGFGEGLVVPVE